MCAINGEPEAMEVPTTNQDILAKVTQKQKAFLDQLSAATDRVINHPASRVVTRSTQPAHLVAVLSVAAVASMVAPQRSVGPSQGYLHGFSILYLASVSIHIGTQFWMTFISGLALYFSLPRHAFGDVQKVLFPKYFSLNAFLSAITLVTFARIHQGFLWQTRHWIQFGVMGTCFLIELLTRVYAVPIVLSLITDKTEMERRVAGVGSEIGRHAPGPLAKCPYYSRLHSSFRRNHLIVATANITTMVCTTLQLLYIQQNWSCFA